VRARGSVYVCVCALRVCVSRKFTVARESARAHAQEKVCGWEGSVQVSRRGTLWQQP